MFGLVNMVLDKLLKTREDASRQVTSPEIRSQSF